MTLPLAQKLYLTQIQTEFEGDTFFPNFDLNDWNEITREQIEHDEKVDFSYCFLTLEKK